MKLAAVTAGLTAITLLAASAAADTVYWSTTPTDTNWGNPANWVGGRVPNSGDFVVITPGLSALISGFVRINGLYIQPGASLVILSQVYVDGGASIQGSMSIAGQPAVFMHRDDVNLEGTITMWSGASIERLNTGGGVFSVRPGASILVPGYDTMGVNIGTALQVDGLIDVRSTHTFSLGAFSSEHHPNSYLSLQPSGILRFSQSGSMAATYVPWQTPPYIVNAGVIEISGESWNVVDFAQNLAVFNAGILAVDRPDVHIRNSLDVANGELRRGAWACLNYGRVFFDVPVSSVGAATAVRYSGAGSTILSPGQITSNYGVISADGSGAFHARSFVNHGLIDLDYQGSFVCDGSFVNAADGVVSTWLAGTTPGQHGTVSAGAALLGGTLNARVAVWYTPASGDVIPTVLAGQLSGAFAQVNTLYSNVTFTPVYDAANMSLAAGCPADFNGDGFLDFFDIDAFTACFEGIECPAAKTADYNHDGFVDFFDADAYIADFESGC